MKPFWKFWGVKGLLSVGWFQALCLTVVGLMAAEGRWADETFRTFLNFYLVCVEAFLLACLNVFAYPPEPLPWALDGDRCTPHAADASNGLEELTAEGFEFGF